MQVLAAAHPPVRECLAVGLLAQVGDPVAQLLAGARHDRRLIIHTVLAVDTVGTTQVAAHDRATLACGTPGPRA